MMLGQVMVMVTLCMVGLVNSKVSLVAPSPTNPTNPTTTLVNRVQPSIEGQVSQRVKDQFSSKERSKTTRKGPLSNTLSNTKSNMKSNTKSNTKSNMLRNTIRRRKPTMVHPTSYLSLAISCHDAAIEVSTEQLA